MVNFKPFSVEDWMDRYETKAKYNIAETCSASISIADLQAFSEEDRCLSIVSLSNKLTYGHIRGSPELRQNLANLYSSRSSSPLSSDNLLITPGAISANYLTLYTLVQPGDHVICHYPTYQQLYSVPESLGAEVSLWKCRQEDNWLPSIQELKALIQPGKTRLIILNNPQNPTGAILPRSMLEEIIGLAKENGNIAVMCDEVYRPIFHSITPVNPDFPPSILSMGYDNVIATGSLSKAYSLAGIRVGWIASRNREIVERIAEARHYTTISVSQLDDAVAAFALSSHTVHGLLSRNIALAKTNLDILERFIIKHDDMIDWVKPLAGTTAFIRFHRDSEPLDSEVICKRLVDEVGVLWVPGPSCFGAEFKGFVRVGFVCETQVLTEGLDVVRKWLRKEYDDLPLAAEQ